MDLRYFSKKNKTDFNFILPKIRRYITTQNTLHKYNYYILIIYTAIFSGVFKGRAKVRCPPLVRPRKFFTGDFI